jgi:hypothetical protein
LLEEVERTKMSGDARGSRRPHKGGMISDFVEVRADGDIRRNRKARKRWAINYKLPGIQSEICKANPDKTLKFIGRV